MFKALQLIRDNELKFLLCSFVEMNGAPKAKLVPANEWEGLLSDGASFAGFAAGDFGQGPHDPDIVSMPDFDALIRLPWRADTAWVPGRLHVEGKPFPYCPRGILMEQLAQARAAGLVLNVGTEPEFMLLKREDGSLHLADPLDQARKPCYDLTALHRNLDIISELLGYMRDLGWEPYAADHEDANCQFEINWKYANALTTADRLTFFKWMVRSIAERRGLVATFMPKPFPHLTGNGAHLHLSLSDKDSGANLFHDPKGPLGLSQMAHHFLGGVLQHAKALSAVIAPTVNSYKRLARSRPNSGATWAPIAVTYGAANRTQMVRIPGPGRIELRAVDGAANPYLALAAILSAGLDGIDRKLDPGKPNEGNLYERSAEGLQLLPANLNDALTELEEDEIVLRALGASYAPYYIKVKREEWRQYHATVSGWEMDRYLGC